MSIIISVLPVFGLYLWLTAGSGRLLGLWSGPELVMGALLSLLTGALSRLHVRRSLTTRGLSLRRWATGVIYAVGPFFLEMAKANLDVAYRVITGRISPGIIRVKSGMKTDFSLMLLANSITLTPGTLSVGVDEETNDLFIHKINLAPGEETREIWEARDLFGLDCPAWIRRIAE